VKRAVLIGAAVFAMSACAGPAGAQDAADSASRFDRFDRNYPRNFLAPTARTLEQGAGYLCSRELLLQGVAYGVTDRISVEVGGVLIPPHVDQAVGYGGLKIGLTSSERFSTAVGGLFATGPELGGFGLGFAMATFGSRDRNVTVGLGGGGWSLVGLGFAGYVPLGFLGTNYRLSESLAIVGEVWSAPLWLEGLRYSPVLLSLRWIGERWAFDAGLITSSAAWGEGEGAVFPVVSLAYNF